MGSSLLNGCCEHFVVLLWSVRCRIFFAEQLLRNRSCVYVAESSLWFLGCGIFVVEFCCGIRVVYLLWYLRCGTFVVESSLLNSCCGEFVVLLWWNLCCGFFVVECLLLNSCWGIAVMFLLWNLCCGIFAVERLLWDICRVFVVEC